MFKKRLSSADPEYQPGALSSYPNAKDTPVTLYQARNNAETQLLHTCTPTSKYLVVKDADRFPAIGILKLALPDGTGEPELIHYFRRIGNQFHLLQRGFAGFRTSNWPAGSVVTCPVVAEHHNILKDAIINIQRKIGLEKSPASDSLHSIITNLETKWLAPKPSFRAWPRSGPAPLKVRFQNVSGGLGVKFFWDLGDGETSTEENPTHTYRQEGNFTVKLNVVSASNAQATGEKPAYITVDNSHAAPFFYVTPTTGYSAESAKAQKVEPTNFTFVDQTDGDILERDWFFGNGQTLNVPDPNVHTANFVFPAPGEYAPNVMIRLASGQILNARLSQKLMVI